MTFGNGLLECSGVTDPVQQLCPALHRDTLEYRQHGKQEVVEVGDAAVGPMPAISALRVVHGAGSAVTVQCAGSRLVLHY